MEAHHKFYVSTLDTFQRKLAQALTRLETRPNDIDAIVADLDEVFVKFLTDFRLDVVFQDATVSQVEALYDNIDSLDSSFPARSKPEIKACKDFFKDILVYFSLAPARYHTVYFHLEPVSAAIGRYHNRLPYDDHDKSIGYDRHVSKIAMVLRDFYDTLPSVQEHIETTWAKLNYDYTKLRKLYLGL